MDFTSATTAAVLLALLLVWNALLKYLERCRRKESGPLKPLPRSGGRKADSGPGKEAGSLVTRRNWRSNGKPPPEARPPRAPGGRKIVFRGRGSRHGFAVACVLLAYTPGAAGNLFFSVPPLIFFGAAVAATFTIACAAPGLSALVLASLLSDHFFVRPTFFLSLDWQVFRLSLTYQLAGLLSALAPKLLSSRAAVN
jgi:hypothetical protein